MPWKLLAFIAVMAVVLVFVGFNLDNRCDVSLVFFNFTGVPVVLTILGSFVLGLLAAFFLTLRPVKRTARVGADRGSAGTTALPAGDAAPAPEPAAPADPAPSGARTAPGGPVRARKPGKRR